MKAYAKLYTLMDDIGPMSCAELVRLTGTTQSSVLTALRRLRELKKVHISTFHRQPDGVRGRCIPIYAVGGGPDAEEPAPKPRRDVCKDYYYRHQGVLLARSALRRGTTPNIWAGLGGRK